MKAQSFIFEQVLLFMIAVSIFIMCFFLFQIYQNHYSIIASNDQVKAVRDMISSQVIVLTKFEGLNASVRVRIPKKIVGEWYRITFSDSSLNVTIQMRGTSASSNLKQLGNRYTFSGNSTSGKGEIIIYKRGYNIIIE